MNSEDDEPPEHSTDGMCPTFIKRNWLSPKLVIGGLLAGGLVIASVIHWAPVDVNAMMRDRLGQRVTQTGEASAATTDKKEAPDPTPVGAAPFPHRAVAPAIALASLMHGRVTASAPPAGRQVSYTGSSTPAPAAAGHAPPPPPPPPPKPPAAQPTFLSVQGDAGSPGEGEATPQASARPGAAQRVAAGTSDDGPHYVPATSPFELSQGWPMRARLLPKVDGELPGQITCVIVADVFSSIDPSVLVVPAGTLGVGRYATASTGQTMLVLEWTRLQFPDGRKFDFDESSTDISGRVGVGGTVNTHAGKQIADALLYTVITGIGNSFTRSNTVVFGGGGVSQVVPQPKPIPPDVYINATKEFEINVEHDLPLDRYETQ